MKLTGLMALLLMIGFGHAAEFNTGQLIVESGHKDELAADEGYLLFAVVAGKDYDRIAFKSSDSLGGYVWFKGAEMGRNHALIKLKAGTYYLEKFDDVYGFTYYAKFLGEQRITFDIKPGVVNYPGTWFLDHKKLGRYSYRYFIELQNQSSYEYPFFATNLKALTGGAPFEYTGNQHDQYLTHLIARVEEHQRLDFADLLVDVKPEQSQPVVFSRRMQSIDQAVINYPDIDDYLSASNQINGGVNKQGQFVLLATEIKDQTIIAIADLEQFAVQAILDEQLSRERQLTELQWIDDDTIHYEITLPHTTENHLAHLTFDESGQLQGVTHMQLPISGQVIAPVKSRDNELFFTANKRGNPGKPLQLYLLDVSNKRSIRKSFRKPHKATNQLENAIQYLIDDQDTVRAAITVSWEKDEADRTFNYWFFDASGQWQKINTIHQDDQPFRLSHLSADGRYFYVLTDRFSDKTAIHRYSTRDLSHAGVFYEHPEHDITGLEFAGENKDLIGYRYTEEGLIKVNYFDQNDDRLTAVQSAVTGMNLYVSEEIKSSGQLLIYGKGTSSEGAWFVYQPNTSSLVKLFDINPEYEQLPKGRFHHIRARNKGFDIEGYLITPDGPAFTDYPLVVLPHGGPVGVRDYAYNDAVQHFFAAQGIATLKVNYRGSTGFGKEFEEAGHQQWGDQIEQDIHAVVLQTLAEHPVNPNKICSMGSSYGGYSAVMLTVLHPDVYRCAVSWAGVMDLPLLFSSQKLKRDEALKTRMQEMVGDPGLVLQQMIEKSPVYLAEKMSRPMLLLQGMRDFTVEYEHAMRMQQMARLHDLDLELVLFPDEGHAFSHADVKIQMVGLSLAFIQEQLK